MFVSRNGIRNKLIALFLIVLVVCAITFVSTFERLPTILNQYVSRVPSNDTTGYKDGRIISDNDKKVSNSTLLSDDMPSIRGTNITVKEIIQNFAQCRISSIAKDKACGNVHKNSTLFWRSSKTQGFTQKDDFKNMNLATRCCAFNHSELMFPAPSSEMFPWERDYLSQGPLTSMADTAWAAKSSVELVGKSKDANDKKYGVGDEVSFVVRLRNGRGENRGRGGDSVRLWLVNSDLGAGVTAKVKDNSDGSYLATVKLPWVGKAVVKATIAHTREVFRSTLYLQRLFTSSHWFTSVFKNSKASEGTPCSPLPYLPGFSKSELCNLTEHNGGIPWYCGKPVKNELTCSDIIGTIKINYPSVTPLSKADKELVRLTEDKRPFLIPTSIALVIEKRPNSSDVTVPIPSVPCKRRDLSTTFNESLSTGYFYKKTWRPFSCALPDVNKVFVNNCLKNTTFVLIGDSNTRAQMDLLRDMTKCEDKIIKTKVKWHAPLRCDIDKNKMSIQFFPQKLPFYGSMGEMMTQKMLTSTTQKLDSIPATGNYLILIHYFLHIAPFHPAITKTRMQHARDAIARLMKRNPTSHVVIQSPHCAYDHSLYNKNKLNVFIFHITKAVFSGLGNRVMFMNTLDITIANQNDNDHPHIAKEFTRFYLGHYCGRL